MAAVFVNREGITIKMKDKSLEKIKDYYNDNQIFYRVFWMNKKNLAMHFGYWYKNTKNKHEALINENKLVAEKLDIKRGDKVLDAGCGVGGTAIWIAENFGVEVSGLTLVKKQVELAKKYAKGRKIENLVSFFEGDFCKAPFTDNSFDKIYAIEAACHATDKRVFLKEMNRLLKPGGKLCIADYFLVKSLENDEDRRVYDTLCRGWAMPDLTLKSDFEDFLLENKFQNIEYIDNTENVMKSAKIMSQSASAWLPIDKTLHFLHLISDENIISTKASVCQWDVFKRGVANHGMFCAEKTL